MGGPLANDIEFALRRVENGPALHSVVAGLGGRPVTRRSLASAFRQAVEKPWEDTLFLDLDERIVGFEIHYRGKIRRSGPMAESILKRLAKYGPPKAAE
mgnify:CR=1 FL=1